MSNDLLTIKFNKKQALAVIEAVGFQVGLMNGKIAMYQQLGHNLDDPDYLERLEFATELNNWFKLFDYQIHEVKNWCDDPDCKYFARQEREAERLKNSN